MSIKGDMIDLRYVKQGAESVFVFIDNYEPTGTSLSIGIKEFFHSRPFFTSIFHSNTYQNDSMSRLL